MASTVVQVYGGEGWHYGRPCPSVSEGLPSLGILTFLLGIADSSSKSKLIVFLHMKTIGKVCAAAHCHH
jgi:hypothetical protein